MSDTDVEHRLIVLEAQVEQLRAEVEGLKIGLVTLRTDPRDHDKLAAMLRAKPEPEPARTAVAGSKP